MEGKMPTKNDKDQNIRKNTQNPKPKHDRTSKPNQRNTYTWRNNQTKQMQGKAQKHSQKPM